MRRNARGTGYLRSQSLSPDPMTLVDSFSRNDLILRVIQQHGEERTYFWGRRSAGVVPANIVPVEVVCSAAPHRSGPQVDLAKIPDHDFRSSFPCSSRGALRHNRHHAGAVDSPDRPASCVAAPVRCQVGSGADFPMRRRRADVRGRLKPRGISADIAREGCRSSRIERKSCSVATNRRAPSN